SNEMRPFFCDSKGLAVPKAEAAIRPISIGDSLYRVAAECCIDLDREGWQDAMGPHQLGSGISGGCEALSTMVSNGLSRGMAAMREDSKNAFNTKDINVISDSVYSNPKLLHSTRIFWWSYGKPTRILLQDKNGKIVATIWS